MKKVVAFILALVTLMACASAFAASGTKTLAPGKSGGSGEIAISSCPYFFVEVKGTNLDDQCTVKMSLHDNRPGEKYEWKKTDSKTWKIRVKNTYTSTKLKPKDFLYTPSISKKTKLQFSAPKTNKGNITVRWTLQ